MVVKFEKLVHFLLNLSEELMIEKRKKYKVSLKEDGTIVTSLDIMVNNLLISELRNIFGRDISIISEENTHEENEKNNTQEYFLIDPIDGTSTMIRGDEFAINIAYVSRNIPIFGIIAIPTRGEVFYNNNSEVYKVTRKSLEALELITGKRDIQNAEYTMIANRRSVIINKKLFGFREMRGALIEKGYEISENILFGIASIKYCMFIENIGDLIASFGNFSTWDLAAAYPMLKIMGVEMVGKDNKPIRFELGTQNSIIFASKYNFLKDAMVQEYNKKEIEFSKMDN